MPKIIREQIGPLFGLLALVGVAIIGSVIPKPTQHHPTINNSYADTKKECVKTELPKVSFWHRTFNDPVAFFTFILAIFTIALVVVSIFQGILILRAEGLTRNALRASKKQARAAQKTAHAAIAIELPVMRAYIEGLLMVSERPPPEGPQAAIGNDGFPEKFSIIDDLTFRNDGRTHAYPLRTHIGWTIATELPGAPIYQEVIESPNGTLIASGKKMVIDTIHICIEAADTEMALVTTSQTFLWVFVQLEYQDFMDQTHIRGFCWKWWRPEGVGMHFFDGAQKVPATYTRKT